MGGDKLILTRANTCRPFSTVYADALDSSCPEHEAPAKANTQWGRRNRPRSGGALLGSNGCCERTQRGGMDWVAADIVIEIDASASAEGR